MCKIIGCDEHGLYLDDYGLEFCDHCYEQALKIGHSEDEFKLIGESNGII